MIALLSGPVVTKDLHRVVVDVHGCGIAANATPGTLAQVHVGEQTTLHTTLVVREDSLTLFAFATADERDTFEAVQTVSGVGPRLALALLAVLSPDELRQSIAGEDVTVLTKVPGVGKKSAQRLILELTGKLGSSTGAGPAAAVAPATAGHHADVEEALVGLGWSAKQAGDAITAVATETDASADASAVLRAALQHLGRSS